MSYPDFHPKKVHVEEGDERLEVYRLGKYCDGPENSRRVFLRSGLSISTALGICVSSNSVKSQTKGKGPTEERHQEIKAHSGSIEFLRPLSKDRFLISGSSGKLKIWDLETGTLRRSIKTGQPGTDERYYYRQNRGNSALPSTDLTESKIASYADNKSFEISVWSLKEENFSPARLDAKFASFVTFSPQGDIVANLGSSSLSAWALSESATPPTRPGMQTRVSGSIKASKLFDINLEYLSPASAIFSEAQDMIAAASGRKIVISKIPDGTEVVVFEAHQKGIGSMEFIENGQFLVTSSEDQRVKIWSIPSGKLIHAFPGDRFSVHPNRKMIAIGSGGKRVELYSIPEMKQLRIYNGYGYESEELLISPKGKYLVFYGKKTINVWDFESGQLKHALASGGTPFSRAAVPAEEDVLISGYSNGSIVLWDLETGRPRGFLFDPEENANDGMNYQIEDSETGITRVFTLPCGAPMPPGATCVCNCIAGTYRPPKVSSGSVTGMICICNLIYTPGI